MNKENTDVIQPNQEVLKPDEGTEHNDMDNLNPKMEDSPNNMTETTTYTSSGHSIKPTMHLLESTQQ